jgi:hypothetical protein
MIRLIAIAAVALAVTTSAQPMTIAPAHGPDHSPNSQVCWHGGACAAWRYY